MAQAASISTSASMGPGFNLKPGSKLSAYVSMIHFGTFKYVSSDGAVRYGVCHEAKNSLPAYNELTQIGSTAGKARYGANWTKAYFAIGHFGTPDTKLSAAENNRRAMALFIMLNKWELVDDGLIAQLPFYLKQISLTDQTRVNWWMNEIMYQSTIGDNVTIVGTYSKMTAPGGKDKFVVTVKSKATGQPVPRRDVKLTIKQGKFLTAASGKTNSKGQFGASYQKTNTLAVTLAATTTSGRSTLAVHNIKKPGQQWMLFTGLKMSRSVSYSYNWKTGVRLEKSCATNCDGTGTVTATAVNTASPWYEVVTIKNKGTGATVKTFRVAPGATRAVALKSTDGTMLDTTVCYAASATAACSTASIKVGSTYEVTCPPAPTVWFSYGCDCAGTVSGAKALVVMPDTIRADKAQIIINGAPAGGLIDLRSSTTQEIELTMAKSGDTVVIRVFSYHQVSGLLLATWDFENAL